MNHPPTCVGSRDASASKKVDTSNVICGQEAEVAAPGYWIDKLTGKTFFFSPNLVWILIALADYFLAPYDFQAAKSFDNLDWVFHRQGFYHSNSFLEGPTPFYGWVGF